MGRTVKPATRRYLFTLQKGLCFYCKRQMDWEEGSPLYCTGDHLKTKKEGGENTIHNYVAACYTCNQNRGHIASGAFAQFVRIYGPGQKVLNKLRTMSDKEYAAHPDMWNKIKAAYPSHLGNHIGRVVQRIEREISTLDVAGSSPAAITIQEDQHVALELPHSEIIVSPPRRVGRNYLGAARSLLQQEGKVEGIFGEAGAGGGHGYGGFGVGFAENARGAGTANPNRGGFF